MEPYTSSTMASNAFCRQTWTLLYCLICHFLRCPVFVGILVLNFVLELNLDFAVVPKMSMLLAVEWLTLTKSCWKVIGQVKLGQHMRKIQVCQLRLFHLTMYLSHSFEMPKKEKLWVIKISVSAINALDRKGDSLMIFWWVGQKRYFTETRTETC